MPSTNTGASLSGARAAAISKHVVKTISAYTGRGPTKACTYLNDDVVTVVLQDTLTKGERSLVAEDLDELVLRMRKAFQGTMRHDLINGIEAILGRTVIAFMSDNHIDPDAAVEVFLLGPADTGPQGDGADGAAKTPSEAMAGAEFGPGKRSG
jgi:uncharacterized protein YbcI